MNRTFTSILEVLQIIGGAYMVWLAVHIMTSQPVESDIKKDLSLIEGELTPNC